MTSLNILNTDNLWTSNDAALMIESHIQAEFAPYLEDSVIKVNLQNKDNEWLVDVIIDSTRGLKAARGKNKNIEALTQKIIEDLKTQFELQEGYLKNEIFLFDHQQEYDHYTETLQTPHKASLKLKVLVIEDDPTASMILEKSLQSLGCQVDIINNPRKAINQITHKEYDLVILDWCLPYMSGLEFLKRADAKLTTKNLGNFAPKAIPLVICSSKNQNEINLPLVSNFLFCQYWNKQLPFSTVVSSIEGTINSARKYKTKAA